MNSPEAPARGLDAGTDWFMNKPFETLELVARVKSMLRIQRTEQAQQESDERYRMLFNAMTDPIMILAKDRTVLEANEAMLKLLGLSQDKDPSIFALRTRQRPPSRIVRTVGCCSTVGNIFTRSPSPNGRPICW